MRVSAAVCVVTLVASLCEGLVVFPESVAELGLFPVPLFFGGLPIHVAVMFIGFYGAMIIGGWAGKSKLKEEFYYDYYGEPGDGNSGFLTAREGRNLGSEAAMRHSLTKTLKQLDADKCLQKLACHLQEQSDRSLEEELLLKLFPATHCSRSLFTRCAAKDVELRELMRYYQRVEESKVR